MELSNEKELKIYEEMLRIRIFEEAAIELWDNNLIKGSIHPYLGEEAIAVGIIQALQKKDYIASTHRGHGHSLAKGANPAEMMAELLGKKTGCCKGRGGSMHVADMMTRNLGANGLVAAGIGIGVGAALTSQMKNLGYIVVAFFGEGATNQGMFHETINLASIWKLPIIFVCENNEYAVSTRYNYTSRVKDASQRAESYGIIGVTIDGNDVLEVYRNAIKYVEQTRRGEGPILIECKTYRWEGHYHGEPQVYRKTEEIKRWKKCCPILRYEKYLEKRGFTEKELLDIRKRVKKEIQDAANFAKESPEPAGETVFDYVYAE